jgi:hypothetical protein
VRQCVCCGIPLRPRVCISRATRLTLRSRPSYAGLPRYGPRRARRHFRREAFGASQLSGFPGHARWADAPASRSTRWARPRDPGISSGAERPRGSGRSGGLSRRSLREARRRFLQKLPFLLDPWQCPLHLGELFVFRSARTRDRLAALGLRLPTPAR